MLLLLLLCIVQITIYYTRGRQNSRLNENFSDRMLISSRYLCILEIDQVSLGRLRSDQTSPVYWLSPVVDI